MCSSLDEMDGFHGILDHFVSNIPAWEAYCDTIHPETEPLPVPWNTQLDMFAVS